VLAATTPQRGDELRLAPDGGPTCAASPLAPRAAGPNPNRLSTAPALGRPPHGLGEHVAELPGSRAQPVSIWCGIGFASASVHVATKREPRAIATAKTSAVRRDVDQRDMFRRSGSGARSGH
jgi:hypothetical protein